MRKHINLFIVGTSYQFLSAVNLSINTYGGNQFENHIYFFKSNRLVISNFELIGTNNTLIKPIDLKNKIEFYKFVSQYNCHRFFFFQENNIINKYAAYYLKKRGTIICLGPDGSKPYSHFQKKHEFISIIKDTVIDYISLFRDRLFLPIFVSSKYYKYGSTSLIDEIYVPYKDLFNHKSIHSKAVVRELPRLTDDIVKKISKTFSFDSLRVENISGNILYFNQPFWSETLIEKEHEILNKIIKNNYNKKLFIKIHPTTPAQQKILYYKITRIIIIDDSTPAEFYLANISNTICITGWSAAIMHNLGVNNKYYYLYPIYKKLEDKVLKQIQPTSFEHIKVLSSVDKVEFFNEREKI